MTWKPIETAPLYTEVLVFGYWKPSFQPPEPRMAVWRRDGREPDDFYCSAINGTATHWTPLPTPPAQAGEAHRAETVKQGSVHEHAVGNADAPKGESRG